MEPPTDRLRELPNLEKPRRLIEEPRAQRPEALSEAPTARLLTSEALDPSRADERMESREPNTVCWSTEELPPNKTLPLVDN
jgi:hypothetical protein